MYVLIHGIVGKPDKKLINVSDCRSSPPFFPLAERNGIFGPCPRHRAGQKFFLGSLSEGA